MSRKDDKRSAKATKAPRVRRTKKQILADVRAELAQREEDYARMLLMEDSWVERMQTALSTLGQGFRHGPTIQGMDSVIAELRGMQSMRISDLQEGGERWIVPKNTRNREQA